MPGYYWLSCLNETAYPEHATIINHVLTGHARVEKISGYHIYKARINHSDRMFWITTIRNGQAHMEIIDVVLNHDYQKSSFLKPGVLKRYLEKRISSESAIVENVDALPCEPAEHLPTARYYNQRFIEFSSGQEQALSAAEPVVITGTAGSGKSCVLFAALNKMLEHMIAENIDGKILYVAQSSWLVNSLQDMWGDVDPRVLFLSYNDLLKQLVPECLEANEIGFEYFCSWLSGYIKKQELACLAGRINSEHLACLKSDPLALLQEFRVIAGLNPADYSSLGRRHSLFYDFKQVLFEAYSAYQSALPARAWDPAFYSINSTVRFYGITVDEALDLSLLQLMTLQRLAENSRVYYAMDSHQRLVDRISHRPLLLEHLGRLAPVTHIQFTDSYRCSNSTIKVANTLIEIKTQISGGVADRHEVSALPLSTDPNKDTGLVVWLDKARLDIDYIREICRSVNTAVVTLPEHVELAKQQCGTSLVFTTEQIKGLDYRVIICWQIFEDIQQHGKYVNQKLGLCGAKAISGHRSKSDTNDDLATPYVNRVITAITRATGDLLFVYNALHIHRHILERLQQSTVVSTSAASIKTKTVVFNPDEWRDHAIELLKTGNEDQARNIFLHELSQSDTDFIEFKQSVLNVRPSLPTASLISMSHSKIMVPPGSLVGSSKSVATALAPNAVPTACDLLDNFTVSNVCQWLLRPDVVASLAKNYRSHGPLIQHIMLQPHLLNILIQALKQLEISDCREDILQKIYKLRFNDIIVTSYISRGDSIIHLAAINNCMSLIELFDARGFELHISNQHGITPLYFALIHQNIDVVKGLIASGADLKMALYPELEELTPDYLAVNYADPVLMSAMVGTTISEYWASWPPLMYFARGIESGSLRSLKDLLKDPTCDVNQVFGENSVTALLVAVQHNNYPAVSELISAGARLNHTMKNGFSALMLAAQFGYEPILRKLLEYGVDVDVQSSTGCTALIIAASYGQIGSVRQLLDAHASIDLGCNVGLETAIELARKRNFPEIVSLLSLAEQHQLYVGHLMCDFTAPKLHAFVKTLPHSISFLFKPIKNGLAKKIPEASKKIFLDIILERPEYCRIFCGFLTANPKYLVLIANLLDSHVNFMRHNINAYGSIELMECLIACPLSKQIVNNSKFLFKAIQKKSLDVVRLIVSNGVDIDVVQAGERRVSTLELAIETSHLGIVCFLLSAGASKVINRVCASGTYPLRLAISRKMELIALALIRSGADVNQADLITGVSPLMLAVSMQLSDKLVQTLLDHGADVLHQTTTGQNVQAIAGECGSSPSIVSLLEHAVALQAAEVSRYENFL